MTDRPIIFSAPMVNAILADRKTMTRRLAWRFRAGNGGALDGHDPDTWPCAAHPNGRTKRPSPWQRITAGDRLWVREAFTVTPIQWASGPTSLVYAADHSDHDRKEAREASGVRWQPSIHMPRKFSRITLEVIAVKIERLQNITEADALSEGISWSDEYEGYHTEEGRHFHRQWPELSFGHLWCALHGDDAWTTNPEVVAITFRRAPRVI